VKDAPASAVVFDLGGVLIDWDPRYLYRSLFGGDEAAMERFLAEVVTPEWNAEQDSGRAWSEAVAVLSEAHPDQRELIAAYHERWPEMLGGPIEGTVQVLDELRRRGVRLFALSNWSAETFPVALSRYDFLDWFEGKVISGEVGIRKPDHGIFRHLIDTYGLEPAATVFIDDTPANLTAAADLGLRTVLFRDAAQLRRDLELYGLVSPAA